MKQLTLTQGSPEWHATRARHFCASEAPAMLGVSKFMTRTELLTQKKTGLTSEVDAATQRLFDAGHQAEADARKIAEDIIGQDLYPIVATREVNGLPLLASFDGLTMDETIVWETKLWNESLAQACIAGELEPHYWAQLEHQLIVSQADTALFTTSDGTEERTAKTWYKSVPERRQQILWGWEQFASDLHSFVPPVIEAQQVGRTPENLPALHIEVTGMVTASNLAEYKTHALSVFAGINRELVTDQHFADAEKTIKWCSDVENRLAAAKEHALSQTASIDELFRAIDDISAEARATRLELDKLVKARKDQIRMEIVQSAQSKLSEHVSKLNDRIGWINNCPVMSPAQADFNGVIKGKRSLASIQDAVDTELARVKIAVNEIADKITLNLRAIHEQSDFEFLFSDAATLALKDPEFVAMAIKNRIANHHAKEAARIEAERALIAEQERNKAQAEERARADAEIAAATAKAQAEAQAAAEEAKRASEEAIAKAAQPTPEAPAPDVMHGALPTTRAQFDATYTVTDAQMIKLGSISNRLGFNLTADFLAGLGFTPAATDKSAKLYRESDFPKICDALVKHINGVMQGVYA